MFDSIRACEGISIIEWEIASRFCNPRVPLSNAIDYKSTLIPTFVFLNGTKRPKKFTYIALVGLGLVQNALFSHKRRPFGILQRMGIASLIFDSNRDSVTIPLASMVMWNIVSILLAANPYEPYSSASETGQTKIDRALVGPSRMLTPNYDPDGVLPTLMTGVSMWLGRWCLKLITSKNESFITGISLCSLGYMCSYAFPRQLPFSETFWTLSFTFGTTGFSLLKCTATDLLCQLLNKSSLGQQAVSGLETLGSHTVELFLISSAIDQLGITKRVESKFDGVKGKYMAAVFKNIVIGISAWALHKRV